MDIFRSGSYNENHELSLYQSIKKTLDQGETTLCFRRCLFYKHRSNVLYWTVRLWYDTYNGYN